MLNELYLELKLHRLAEAGDVLIYGNYIASIDGRISQLNASHGEFEAPNAITNLRDWRLYQELAAQSDIMVTSARYFRQLDRGCAQDLLPVGMQPAYADLLAWREAQGLKAQPDVLIVSASLDIPLASIERLEGRRICVLTGESADPQQIELLREHGGEVFTLGAGSVDGMRLRQWLIGEDYRSAYMIAGPEVFRTLVVAEAIDQLFLTTHLSLLGGEQYHTLLEGSISMPVHARLMRLFFDENVASPQMFAQYALRQ